MTENYGEWDYHERIKPGVLVHVAKSGDKLFTVRVGSPRTMSADTVRIICEIADKHCEGFLRFTTRCNVEFMCRDESEVEPLIATIGEKFGWPLGGTGPSVSNIAHTQGWLHCNLPGSDAAGSTKALMDDLIADFTTEDLPNRVHISSSCCQINCASHGDISIIVQHHHAPRINHANMQICELPKVVAICPAAAIRPKLVNGKESVEVIEENVCTAVLVMANVLAWKFVIPRPIPYLSGSVVKCPMLVAHQPS